MPSSKQTYYTSKKFTTSEVSKSGLSLTGYKAFWQFTTFEQLSRIGANVARAHVGILLGSLQLLKNA